MSWFRRKPCEACLAKDAHLESLRSEVASLRKLVIPPSPAELFSPAHREADLLLNPDTNARDISDAQYEAAAIMSGNYDGWAVEVQ